MNHGTTNAYSNQGCRCVECRKAWAAYCRLQRQRREGNTPADKHGLRSTYVNNNCRCEACTEAATRYNAELLERSRK